MTTRTVSTLHTLCKQFDKESNVPVTTSAHTTRSDKSDIQKAVKAILDNELLTRKPGRSHRSFRTMRLHPLWNWERKETIEWIEKDFRSTEELQLKRMKMKGMTQTQI